jgi:hypothetical protein
MFRRFSLALLAAVLLAASVVAADVSQTYSPLAQSPLFRSRVSFTIAQQAGVVLTEAGTNVTPPNVYNAVCHTLRASLAQGVARNPDGYAPVFASHLVTHINITSAGAPTGSLANGTLDSPATDAALLAAVAGLWSTVSGCITNP